MRTWIRNPLDIFVDETTRAEGGLVIEEDKIAECIASGSEPSAPVDQIFDASAHVVLPGLINTHHHYYQTLTRAVPVALKKGLFPWPQTPKDRERWG